eukprot:8813432-Pyramimonas_sp.AAC.1
MYHATACSGHICLSCPSGVTSVVMRLLLRRGSNPTSVTLLQPLRSREVSAERLPSAPTSVNIQQLARLREMSAERLPSAPTSVTLSQ